MLSPVRCIYHWVSLCLPLPPSLSPLIVLSLLRAFTRALFTRNRCICAHLSCKLASPPVFAVDPGPCRKQARRRPNLFVGEFATDFVEASCAFDMQAHGHDLTRGVCSKTNHLSFLYKEKEHLQGHTNATTFMMHFFSCPLLLVVCLHAVNAWPPTTAFCQGAFTTCAKRNAFAYSVCGCNPVVRGKNLQMSTGERIAISGGTGNNWANLLGVKMVRIFV